MQKCAEAVIPYCSTQRKILLIKKKCKNTFKTLSKEMLKNDSKTNLVFYSYVNSLKISMVTTKHQPQPNQNPQSIHPSTISNNNLWPVFSMAQVNEFIHEQKISLSTHSPTNRISLSFVWNRVDVFTRIKNK